MNFPAEQIHAVTSHKRRGAISNTFRYGVDYVLIDPENTTKTPILFSRNCFNLNSIHDVDHGGPLKEGSGAKWARKVFSEHGLISPELKILLLTQPRFLMYSFNPVSFWLALIGDALVAVISEVSTPFAQRHSYLCHQHDFTPITKDSRMSRPKLLHVSPFQNVEGDYEFIFDIRPKHIDIRIIYRNENDGVIATLQGAREPLSSFGLLKAGLRRPLGALRTMILIHWQALRLKFKGAKYRTTPPSPKSEVS
ncbi:MAG: DUF1365 domain-containing protein [Paracoccaceae bacterium]|nr:DUF1365 domain-containing protein [Paracoccaceae bacterium]